MCAFPAGGARLYNELRGDRPHPEFELIRGGPSRRDQLAGGQAGNAEYLATVQRLFDNDRRAKKE